MRRSLAAAALLCSLAGCALEPSGYTLGVGHGDSGFSGGRGATDGLEMDTTFVYVEVHWDAHKPVSHEVRALRNDMRARHHEASVEEEAERDRAELIEEAAAAAASVETPEDRGGYDWIYENVEVWAFLLVGILGVLWRVGVWVGKREQQEQKP